MSILLKIIRAHHDAVPDGCTALNNAAYPNHAAFQVRIRYDASIRNDGLPQRGSIDFASRQKARMRVNRRFGVEETVFGHQIGEIQICLVKGPDCPNILPVTLENKRAHMPIFDRLWNDMFPEIEHVVLQTFDQHLPVEDVYSHRSLEYFFLFIRINGAEQL